jgi:hypothetical protein
MSGNDVAALITVVTFAFLFCFWVLAMVFVVCNPHLFYRDDRP